MIIEVVYHVFVVLGDVCFDGIDLEFVEQRFSLIWWKEDFY